MPDPRTRLLDVLFSRRMAVAFAMGVACGLPLLLTMGVLQAWMTEAQVDLTWVGMITLVQIPYAWKFLWAPLLDRYRLPLLGRRRGWLLASQVLLAASIAALGFSDPARHPVAMVVSAMLVAFFSATQDVVVDAYRREDLADDELGLGSSLYVYGYRVGMWASSGGALILADHIPFGRVYLLMAGGMLFGIGVTLLAPEPRVDVAPPQSLREAMWRPMTDLFGRAGIAWILAFILLYKVGDTMAAAISTPFYLELGFSKSEIGAVVKLFGSWATIGGAILGGALMLRLGIHRSLWVFGVLQAVSTAGYAVLARAGASLPVLAGVIGFESVTGGMGTSAFVAFMASLTDRRFTATQYALLTSVMGLPRVLASAPTGFAAKHLGWEAFFIVCTLAALPGLLLLPRFAPWRTAAAQPAERR
ncbi:MAG TPA: AmpG family muropeptide MFS transporter [Desulfobacterales bacterium]|nr:AmpG family muropeptide MFS transporter [Desulfobacterales bacterium]